MSKQAVSSAVPVEAQHPASVEDDLEARWRRVVGRRSFLKGVGLAGAAAVPGSALFAGEAIARSGAITNGDVAILRLLAAVELIESDLWQQYNELGGVNGGNPAYMAALSNLDSDMPQYIADNTDDELSHAAFLNAYLRSKGAKPVNLNEFRTLPSSKARGAKQIGRLTNLQTLDVDTSWYVRYRSTPNPDLGARFPQAVKIKHEPGIPLKRHCGERRTGSPATAVIGRRRGRVREPDLRDVSHPPRASASVCSARSPGDVVRRGRRAGSSPRRQPGRPAHAGRRELRSQRQSPRSRPGFRSRRTARPPPGRTPQPAL